MRDVTDDLAPITFGQALLCGMAGCETHTTSGLVERDQRVDGLWRLLPICARCLSSLRAGGRARLRERGEWRSQ
ncbi:MAG: hypothetical protein KGO05_09455 [Chloroflexota bacterium]|nr:hypothetical protein [Chloroflexota bacterium]